MKEETRIEVLANLYTLIAFLIVGIIFILMKLIGIIH